MMEQFSFPDTIETWIKDIEYEHDGDVEVADGRGGGTRQTKLLGSQS